jgi:hypothetical protein
VREEACGGKEGVGPVACQEDEGAFRAQHPTALAESCFRDVQVLDHEVGVDEVEVRVLEGQPGAETGDDEAVEGRVLGTSARVDVDTDEFCDPVAVAGEARIAPAAGVQRAGPRAKGVPEEASLDVGMGFLKGYGASVESTCPVVSSRLLSSDMSQYEVERSRHLGEIKCLDEQTCVSDLPAAAAAHETPKLLLRASSLPRRLLLESAEGSKVSLVIDDLFHRGGTERADQLVLQVVDAHVETESFQAGASEAGTETGPLESALEVALLCGVTETRQPDVRPLRPVQIEEPSDGLRTTNGDDRNALGAKVPTAALGERFDGNLVADPFNEHDRMRIDAPVHLRIFTARPRDARGARSAPSRFSARRPVKVA